MELSKICVEFNNKTILHSSGRSIGIAFGKIVAKLRLKGMI